MQILVDGYNLLHALGRMRYIRGPGVLERRREWLAEFLATSLPTLRDCITIVFDCSSPNDRRAKETRLHGIRVRFTEHKNEQADDLIEETLRKTPKPPRIIVVSNDRRLAEAARRSGAVLMTCSAFLDWLEEKPSRANRHNWPSWVDDLKQGATKSLTNPPSLASRLGRRSDETSAEESKKTADFDPDYWKRVFGDLDHDPRLGNPPYPFE